MPSQPFIIDRLGLGWNSTLNPGLIPLGACRTSQNLLHNRPNNMRAVQRAGTLRVFHTRTNNSPVYSLYEFTNNSGTRTLMDICNGNLESFSLIPGTKTTLKTGLSIAGPAIFATYLNFALIADNRASNYITDGTSGNSYVFQIAAPNNAFTAVPSAGTGLTAGTYQYDYARISSITGEISPCRGTAVSASPAGGNLQVTLTNGTIATSAQFDKIRLYRTKVGTLAPYYQLADITIATFNTGYVDSISDASLTILSTVHDANGASNTSQPEGATDTVLHRGRLHFIGLSGHRSRHRWSQIFTYQFGSTTNDYHEVEQDDGDFLVRGISFDGTLILFKEHSIHIMNGDVDSNAFTWQVASPKYNGIGAYCPFTVVPTPIGIIFQSEAGVYVYRPGGLPQRISDPIQATLDGLDYTKRGQFVAGYDHIERAYILSATLNGKAFNSESYAFFIDTGYWSKWTYGVGQYGPSGWGNFHNSSSRLKAYFGDNQGYVYETDTGTNDGIISGTSTGSATGGGATSITDTTAAFYTTGDGFTGLSATDQTGTGDESQIISSNTSTALTTSAWSTVPVAGDTYYVGAIETILSLGALDFGNLGYKHITLMRIYFQRETHTTKIKLGYTLDNDAEPTTYDSEVQNNGFFFTLVVNRICQRFSPFIRCIGNADPLEILKIEINYTNLTTRLPRI